MDNSIEAIKLPDLKMLGTAVRQTRKAEGLSQKKLADLVGCSHVSILNLEKGTGSVNLNTAWRILDALGMINNKRTTPGGHYVKRDVGTGRFMDVKASKN